MESTATNSRRRALMEPITNAQSYFSILAKTAGRLPYHVIDCVADALLQAYEDGSGIYLFGNGGSAALASHFAFDFGKGGNNRSPKTFRGIAFTANSSPESSSAKHARVSD